nr:MAG TPA: hypothetical protein [Caudoviricetes sp.]
MATLFFYVIMLMRKQCLTLAYYHLVCFIMCRGLACV